MQKQNGFTLVELAVVIIILGILAVTAAPKFINMQGDARAAALKGLKAGIEGKNGNLYSKAAIAGELDNRSYNQPIIGDTTPLGLTYGYLSANTSSLSKAMNIDIGFMISDSVNENADLKNEWIGYETKNAKTDVNSIKIWEKGAPQNCYLEYTESPAFGKLPTYSHIPSASNC